VNTSTQKANANPHANKVGIFLVSSLQCESHGALTSVAGSKRSLNGCGVCCLRRSTALVHAEAASRMPASAGVRACVAKERAHIMRRNDKQRDERGAHEALRGDGDKTCDVPENAWSLQ
jgi:hypothetical protein